jgi:hypothetical protein
MNFNLKTNSVHILTTYFHKGHFNLPSIRSQFSLLLFQFQVKLYVYLVFLECKSLSRFMLWSGCEPQISSLCNDFELPGTSVLSRYSPENSVPVHFQTTFPYGERPNSTVKQNKRQNHGFVLFQTIRV